MNPRLILFPLIMVMAAANAAGAWAQDKGAVNPKPLPPLANPNDPNIGAKELFGRKVLPAAMPTRVLGFYAHGCIAGAEGLPINGDNWQVMRLSRNRYWGHPNLVALVKRLAAKARRDAGWPGILVGDMSQPRGGPMFTGHASHQVGLDADIAVFDPRTPWTYRAADTPSAADWSPFDGWSFAGRVEATYLRGRRVFQDGRVVGPAGAGAWLPRH